MRPREGSARVSGRDASCFRRRKPCSRRLTLPSALLAPRAPLVRADDYVSAFQGAFPGANVQCVPVLSIGPTAGSEAVLVAELEGMGTQDLLALTSQHAAAAVSRAVASSERARTAVESAGADGRVFAVGAKTAQSLPAGVLATGLSAGTGGVLAAHIASKARGEGASAQLGGRVLYPCGETRRPELETALAEADVEVVPVPVYASTQRSPEAIQADLDAALADIDSLSGLGSSRHGAEAAAAPGGVTRGSLLPAGAPAAAAAGIPRAATVLCFFSPRGAEAAFRTALVARLRSEGAICGVVWAAIGTTTAKALERRDVARVVVAPAPGPAELAGAVAAALSRESAA